jgi:hypothetical protein
MSRLNKTQSYAILWMNSQGISVDQISKELTLTEKQINSVLEKNGQTPDASIKTKTSSVAPKESKTKSLMITESLSKKAKVAIMTKEASSLNDELKKQAPNVSTTKRDKGIFRPSENK